MWHLLAEICHFVWMVINCWSHRQRPWNAPCILKRLSFIQEETKACCLWCEKGLNIFNKIASKSSLSISLKMKNFFWWITLGLPKNRVDGIIRKAFFVIVIHFSLYQRLKMSWITRFFLIPFSLFLQLIHRQNDEVVWTADLLFPVFLIQFHFWHFFPVYVKSSRYKSKKFDKK